MRGIGSDGRICSSKCSIAILQQIRYYHEMTSSQTSTYHEDLATTRSCRRWMSRRSVCNDRESCVRYRIHPGPVIAQPFTRRLIGEVKFLAVVENMPMFYKTLWVIFCLIFCLISIGFSQIFHLSGYEACRATIQILAECDIKKCVSCVHCRVCFT